MIQTVFPQKYRCVPAIIYKQVVARDGDKCQRCFSEKNLDTHHIIPIRKGGSNELSNLITLCRKCHKTIEPSTKQNYAYKLSRKGGSLN